MIQFADEANITVQSGKGGNGCISFRREKYIPMGGPNGGDGGCGGDIIFCCKRNMRTLASIRFHHIFKAQNGSDGQGWNRYGKDGEDTIIPLPPGTTIWDADTNEKIREFTTESDGEQFKFLEGGKGGWGNVHFKSSTNQAPRYAHKGKPGEVRNLRIELSIMADIGLVGFPNAGKSSLLDAFTNARPKIAPYPFTTKIPNLGVLRADNERDVIIADIPGIIEGASEGAGLGIRFLKHISRTLGLLFMIDCADDNYLTAYQTLCGELGNYSKELLGKPHIVLCNKIDIEGADARADEVIAAIKKIEPKTKVLKMSVVARTGMNEVRLAILDLVNSMEPKKVSSSPDGEFTDAQSAEGSAENSSFSGSGAAPAKSSFMSSRSVDPDAAYQTPGSEDSGENESAVSPKSSR